ncbi:MAG TPA: hypothetical protein VKB28_10290 [Solirubrobacteraceae bacterium]|jgi:hypothetical protein|nr:hypothetical protein [Solirubrobacteraceae bacterium]
MPRLPRRTGAAGARRPGGVPATVAATLARRREGRATRVVVRDGAGQPRVLDAGEDPVAQALVEAAEDLISAAQRGSGV